MITYRVAGPLCHESINGSDMIAVVPAKTAHIMLAALKALREAAENSVYNSAPTVAMLRAYEQADIAARAAIAKAEGC